MGKAATASRQHLIASAHPVTGLYPDYSRFDGRAYAWRHAAYDTSIYMFDAIRCPINVGMDYYLCGKDCHRQKAVMYRLLTFFKNDGFKHGHFTLDGSKAFGQYTCGMAGANAVGAITLAQSNIPEYRELAREYVQRLWDVNRRQASSDIMKVWSIFFLCYTYQDVSHWTSDIKIDYKTHYQVILLSAYAMTNIHL